MKIYISPDNTIGKTETKGSIKYEIADDMQVLIDQGIKMDFEVAKLGQTVWITKDMHVQRISNIALNTQKKELLISLSNGKTYISKLAKLELFVDPKAKNDA